MQRKRTSQEIAHYEILDSSGSVISKLGSEENYSEKNSIKTIPTDQAVATIAKINRTKFTFFLIGFDIGKFINLL